MFFMNLFVSIIPNSILTNSTDHFLSSSSSIISFTLSYHHIFHSLLSSYLSLPSSIISFTPSYHHIFHSLLQSLPSLSSSIILYTLFLFFFLSLRLQSSFYTLLSCSPFNSKYSVLYFYVLPSTLNILSSTFMFSLQL